MTIKTMADRYEGLSATNQITYTLAIPEYGDSIIANLAQMPPGDRSEYDQYLEHFNSGEPFDGRLLDEPITITRDMVPGIIEALSHIEADQVTAE